jgi:hypothetical protein
MPGRAVRTVQHGQILWASSTAVLALPQTHLASAPIRQRQQAARPVFNVLGRILSLTLLSMGQERGLATIERRSLIQSSDSRHEYPNRLEPMELSATATHQQCLRQTVFRHTAPQARMMVNMTSSFLRPQHLFYPTTDQLQDSCTSRPLFLLLRQLQRLPPTPMAMLHIRRKHHRGPR